ncbi:uncharacterized protein LOC134536519 [Bacillus rossius redtenbacheri]|uniref:uncharacterized protein LOC134536519 n=1 Tax=Bacillus rossius redtenbacheri TaxID=93214 RepID=UPI002FDEEE0F
MRRVLALLLLLVVGCPATEDMSSPHSGAAHRPDCEGESCDPDPDLQSGWPEDSDTAGSTYGLDLISRQVTCGGQKLQPRDWCNECSCESHHWLCTRMLCE